jgi:hypothetical protein
MAGLWAVKYCIEAGFFFFFVVFLEEDEAQVISEINPKPFFC